MFFHYNDTMKKLLCLLLPVMLLLSVACVSQEPAPDVPDPLQDAAITIETAEGERLLALSQILELDSVTVQATVTDSSGFPVACTYSGAKLSDILLSAGVTQLSQVAVSGADGYAVLYSRSLALAEDTILAWEKDGEPINGNPPLLMIPVQGEDVQIVKYVSKIIVL